MTRRHYFLLALVPVLFLTLWHYLSPAQQLKASQQKLMTAISQKDVAACSRLIHPDYTDQWNFTASDWPLILKDLRALSPVLEIKLLEPVFDATAGAVDTSLQIKSSGGLASSQIDSQGARLKEKTRFIWKRIPWCPWSWRLVSMQNPDFDVLSGYRPGSLSEQSLF